MKSFTLGICGAPVSGSGHFCRNVKDFFGATYSKRMFIGTDLIKESNLTLPTANIKINEFVTPLFHMSECFNWLGKNSDIILFMICKQKHLFKSSKGTIDSLRENILEKSKTNVIIAINDPFSNRSPNGYASEEEFPELLSTLSRFYGPVISRIGRYHEETNFTDIEHVLDLATNLYDC